MGNSDDTKPSFVEIEYSIPFYENEYCFSVTYVLPDRVIVDCTKEVDGAIQDYFIIVRLIKKIF